MSYHWATAAAGIGAKMTHKYTEKGCEKGKIDGLNLDMGGLGTRGDELGKRHFEPPNAVVF